MAVVCATSGDYLQRTSGFLAPGSSSTVMLWVNPATIPVGPAYKTSYILMDDPGVYTQYAGLFDFSSAGKEVHLDIGSVLADGDATNDTWVHLAWVQTGTGATSGQRLYVNGTSVGTGTVNRSAFAIGFEILGNDGTGSDGDLQIAYVREWQAALTGTEIRAELGSKTVQRTANLFLNCPLESDALDISGNGHDFTEIGSVTYTDDTSPLATNSVIADAIAVGSLPQDITLDAGSVGDFWYVYGTPSDQVMIGVFAISESLSDTVHTNIYLGPTGSPMLYLGLSVDNLPMQVPVEAGTLYYIQVSSLAPFTTDATLSVIAGPTDSVPVGSIFTSDDVVGFRTGAVSSTDGANYAVLQFFDLPATNSENGGDILEDGHFLIAADDTSELQIYTGQLELQTTVAALVTNSATVVRTCLGAQVWYVAHLGAPNALDMARIDSDGTVTDTWTTASSGFTGIAASNDESIIYVAGQSSSINSPIKQWDPNTSTFGANLVAGVANYTTGDLLVTGDDSILACYASTISDDIFVRRYSSAGATLNTYQPWGPNIGDAASNTVSLFHALDDPTSFWVRVHNVVDATTADTCTFYNIRVSDGTALAAVTQAQYEDGIWSVTAPSLTPPARFGLSLSCPSFILREAIGPGPTPGPGTPEEFIIRRERWFPVINQENQRMTFSMLQIDLQAGNGLTDGQGENPLLELDWSDDAGWTWSNIRFLPTGRLGQYNRRAIARVLGQSRQRVFRIAVSDPVQWVVLDGYMQLKQGTN